MVVVAQLVEPRIVIPVVAGSSPVDHPTFNGRKAVFQSVFGNLLQRGFNYFSVFVSL